MINIREKIEEKRRLSDCGIMQYPDELEPFIQFMIDNNVKSYLEIGVKRGHNVLFMKELGIFDKIYACDVKYPEDLNGHSDIVFLHASSHGETYRKWRKSLGLVDMVLIDADHKERAFRADYKVEMAQRHRFVAMHDIANIGYPKLSRFWKNEVQGKKIEFVNKDPSARLICIEHKDDEYMANYRKKYATSCGIGVSWK
tara:strand:- start:575 stop:1171 length:597 start_codon:yes stop_codon:yes gene_type:complete